MPLLKPPDPKIPTKKYYIRLEEPVARDDGALCGVPGHTEHRSSRHSGHWNWSFAGTPTSRSGWRSILGLLRAKPMQREKGSLRVTRRPM